MKRSDVLRGAVVAVMLVLIATVALALPTADRSARPLGAEGISAQAVSAESSSSPSASTGLAGKLSERVQSSISDAKSLRAAERDKPKKNDKPPIDPETPSEPSSPTVPPQAPEPPGSITEVACFSGDMRDVITFTPPADGGPVSEFVLSRALTPDGPFREVATVGADASVVSYSSEATGYAYYNIVARGAGGSSARSGVVSNERVKVVAEVGPLGRSIRASNGEVMLALPAGAYDTTTTVTIEEMSGSPVGGIIAFAGVYDIRPSGTLGAPATLSVAYSLAVTHFQVSEALLRAAGLLTFDAGTKTWVNGATNVRAKDGYIAGEVTHFSEWTPGSPSPHGTSAEAAGYCSGVCHDLSTSPGSATRYSTRDPQVCYNCHGNPDPNAAPAAAPGENVQGSITGAASMSAHPVMAGGFYCTACHDPHAGSASSPGLLRAWDPVTGVYVQGGKGTAPGTVFCWTCHGSTANRRINYFVPGYYASSGGDHKTWLTGTAHADLTSPENPNACRTCHASHGSSSSALAVVGTVDGRAVTGNDQSLCRACHEVAVRGYSGEELYATTKHSTVVSSTKAATTWPSSQSAPGGCQNCHNPHGTANENYLRASGSALCKGCHDVAGLSYPADYSYQGATPYSGSGHAGLTGGVSYIGLNSVSDGFAVWQSNTLPTPSAPGTPITDAAALDLLSSVNGSRLSTRYGGASGTSDYQMYRFDVPSASSEVINATLRWAGYGESTPGYPVSISLWVPSTSSWQTVTTAVMGSQQMVTTDITPATHMDSNGYVYVLAQAKHVRDGEITAGPTFTKLSDTSIKVDWTTAGVTTSWVDYGLTAAYGSTMGSADRTTTHSVTITGLTAGAWNFRVRSDATPGDEAESYVSGNFRYGFPTPKLAAPLPASSLWAGVPETRTVYWQSMSGTAGPYQYRLRLYTNSSLALTTDWMSGTSYSLTNLVPASYQVMVEARDASGLSYGWSAGHTFYISEPSGSCPFLFTWDGDSFEFESDVMMSGKLGNKVATGYQLPNPQDAYTLRTAPATEEGRWKFRMVEERFEVDYIDRLQLFAADAPAGYRVYAEKPGVGGTVKQVAAQLHTVKDPVAPVSALRTDTGEDISALIANDDDRFVVLSEDRNEFGYKTIELDLGEVSGASQVKLLIDGVSAFFNSPEGTARSATFGPRTKVEVQRADGSWYLVPASQLFMPVPPEFARTYVFDITRALEYGGPKVRLTFLYKTYIDMIKVDTSPDQPITLTEAPLLKAELRHHGLDGRKVIFEDVFEHLYGPENPTSMFFPGAYTAYRDVVPLLTARDDEFAIMGGGDELAIEFGALPDPAAGVERQLVVGTYGFYKDKKTDLASTVEPLPFTAMSNYPYAATESYPDDAEHAAYQAEWNSRMEPEAGAVAGTTSASRISWRRSHFVSQMDQPYSVNTDYIRLRKNVASGLAWVDPVGVWESQSAEAAKPTPASPGAVPAVSPLSAVASSDDVWWETDLASAEGNWNWQVFRFELGASAFSELKGLDLLWEGYGEPTAGHPTAVYIWNPQTAQWVQVERKVISTDSTVGSLTSAIDSGYCLKCHDGAPPAGVVLGSITNIGATWNLTTTDYHGGKSGTGTGGTLAPGYARGTSVPCSTCHETHGSASPYHFPAVVNGKTLPVITGTNSRELCLSCHVGTNTTFHQSPGCNYCHGQYIGDHDYTVPSLDVYVIDCLDCHQHSKSWRHPESNPNAFYCWACASEHGGPPSGAPAF